jgi:Asp-tRNA(Asn)/Glu-tRNA(Gln) amidotransferase A subunit family amidase
LLEAVCVIFGDALTPAASAPPAAWIAPALRGEALAADDAADAIIGPVVADVAPLHRPLIGDDYVFTLPWSLTGWPAMSLPFGVDPSTRLPLAVQVVAPQWRDDHVPAAAAVLEKSAPRTARPDRS